jgi:hypothetical protein
LTLIGHEFGWTLPDSNFRYLALFDPDIKDFWEWTGLDVNDNRMFFLSKNAFCYYWVETHPTAREKYKILKSSLFGGDDHSDYAELKDQMMKRAKVPKEFFEKIERTYLVTQLRDLIPTLARIVRPLFLVAHFLEKEDPDIYDYHQELSKIFLSAMNSKNEHLKNWAVSEVWVRRIEDFLFHAVWEDFLFDGKKYLQKPKPRNVRRGKPPKPSNSLVWETWKELKKYKEKLSESVDLATAKLINFLTRDERFNISKRHPEHYYNLGAEAVRHICSQAEKMFGRTRYPNENRKRKLS